MKRVLAATFVSVLLAVVAVQGQEGGWVRLFDGKTLSQWTPVGNANWKVVNGEIWSTDGGGFLLSKQTYTNFEIRADFWVTPDANSGIFIRCQDPVKVGAATCYEVNIFDTRPDQSYRTGGIVDVAKPASVINADGGRRGQEVCARPIRAAGGSRRGALQECSDQGTEVGGSDESMGSVRARSMCCRHRRVR